VNSNRILFGGMAALLIGGVVFLIVQMSSSARGETSALPLAAASCTKENTVDCLPKVTFIDSTQEF
jgi:hypothetical protein